MWSKPAAGGGIEGRSPLCESSDDAIPLVLIRFTLSLTTAAAAQTADPLAGTSDTAFVFTRAGLIPENIVYDAPRDRSLGGDGIQNMTDPSGIIAEARRKRSR